MQQKIHEHPCPEKKHNFVSSYTTVEVTFYNIQQSGYEKGNLRWVDYNTQIANQRFSGKGKNKYIGVNFSKTHNRWVARVTFKSKCLFSKVCKTQKEAFEARKQYILDNKLPHTIQEWSGE